MSPNPRPGEEVRVPCRHCCATLIKMVARAGSTVISCPSCQGRTQVQMESSEGSLVVRTVAERGA